MENRIKMILQINDIQKRARNRRMMSRFKKMQDNIKQQVIQFQTQLYSSSVLWTEKILGSIKVDYGKVYMRPKISTNAWENILMHFTTNQWIENFRMTKETFLFICSIVKEDLEPKTYRAVADNLQSLTVEKQVAIAIYKLASYCEFRVVASQFGVGKSTVHKCLHRFCESMNKHVKEFIYMPDDDEAKMFSLDFEKICKIPQIIGCIDGTHIPILAPKDGYRDFVNRKYWPSFNMQAVCNAQLRFLDISCKFPGSCHDAHVFVNSGLYKNIDNILPHGTKEVEGKDIPFFILADPAYPLLPWVIKNFPTTADQDEISFNAYMNTGRVKIENAFLRLKGRWHILAKRCDLYYKSAPKMIMTCCILHNICESKDKNLNGMVFPQPPTQHVQPSRRASAANNDTLEGVEIREHLKLYINKNFPQREVYHF